MPRGTQTPTSPLNDADAKKPHIPTYYEKLGRACDWIFRCKDCKRLTIAADVHERAGCGHCGSRELAEVRTLTFREWLRLKLGILDFPHRKDFLAEFSRGKAAAR